jgi:hypothetical protein
MGRIFRVLWAPLALLLVLPVGPAGAATIDASQLANAIRVRTELGFDARPELVERILLERPGGTRGGGFTEAESTEVERRTQLMEGLGDGLAFLDDHRREFGGHYFDHRRHGVVLVVNLPPGTAASTTSALMASTPDEGLIEFRAVRYSLAELEAVRDAVFDALPRDQAKTAHVDPRLNRVVLSVPRGMVATADRIVENAGWPVLLEIGGPVTGAACVSRASCEVPWRGGIHASGCTWGFNARPVGPSSTRYVLGGGHCQQLGDDVFHDGAIVNTAVGVDRNTFDMANPTSEAFRAPLQVDAGARNLVYISNGNMAYAITQVATAANQAVGTPIAISGRSSSYIEGTIQAVDLLAEVCRGSDCYVTKVNRVTFSIMAGDSGAPILHRTLPKAFGINYGTAPPDTRGLFTPIHRVNADMLTRLCVDAGCT